MILKLYGYPLHLSCWFTIFFYSLRIDIVKKHINVYING